jgi:hypothetical protein
VPGDIDFRRPNGRSATQTKDRQVPCTALNDVKKIWMFSYRTSVQRTAGCINGAEGCYNVVDVMRW